MKPLTETQVILLDTLRATARKNVRADGGRVRDAVKGGVEMRVLDCYDSRSVRGLFNRGLLVWADHEHRYDAFVMLED